MRLLILPITLLMIVISFAPIAVGANQEQVTPQPSPMEGSHTPPPGSEVQIISPKPGSALQGSVPVIVDTTTQDFQIVELTFKYLNDPTMTWFLIYQGIQPVTGTMLVLWDTSTITDGEYTLRMTVTMKNGSQKSVLAEGIRVRNYTPIETNTPPPPTTTIPAPIFTPPAAPSTPVSEGVTPAPTAEKPLEKVTPTSTRAPGNPAEVNRTEVWTSMGKGALVAVGLIALGAIYATIRSNRRMR